MKEGLKKDAYLILSIKTNKKTKMKLSIQNRIQICVTDLCISIIRLMPGKDKHD